MLEKYYKDPGVAGRLERGLLGPHLKSFTENVTALGYKSATIKGQLCVLGGLSTWLERSGFEVSDLDESVLTCFFDEKAHKGHRRRGEEQTLRQFLDHLRSKEIVPVAPPEINESPLQTLRTGHEKYLEKERGASSVTASRYWPFIEQFLDECFGDAPIRLEELGPEHITVFLIRHAHDRTPKIAQLMVCSLRSFFRFVFEHGKISKDMSALVPPIPTWQMADLPKYLKPEEIEQLLGSCDQTNPVGRRNFAILLVLARLGLRAGEVVGLELDDIDWRTGVVTVRGKGFTRDHLPIPHEVGQALVAYIRNDRPKDYSRRVFLRLRAPIRGFNNPSTVSAIVSRALTKAGLNPVLKGAHLLRHSLATNLLRNGAAMIEIGEILRHRSPNSTEIYTKVDIEGLRSIAKPWPCSTSEVHNERT